jgi:hypothetical protein
MSNTARAKTGTTADTKKVVDFAERLRYMLELKINKLRITMQKESNTRGETYMIMIRIQALEWVQGRIQDIIVNNVTRDWPVYDTQINNFYLNLPSTIN